MRKRPGVKIVADFSQELAVGSELEKLRGGRGVGRSSGVAAREDEDVSLRIDRHTSYFAEV